MSSPLTPEGRAALRALCREATPGPWSHVREDNVIVAESVGRLFDIQARSIAVGPAQRDANAAYVAAFDPTTCEALLDAADDLARVREALERVRREGCTSAGCDTIGPPARHEHSLCCPVGIARLIDAALAGGKVE